MCRMGTYQEIAGLRDCYHRNVLLLVLGGRDYIIPSALEGNDYTSGI